MEPNDVAELSRQYCDALNQLGGLIVAIERKISERGKTRPLSYSVREENVAYEFPFPIPHFPSANTEEHHEAKI
jgi:hypothetical protein